MATATAPPEARSLPSPPTDGITSLEYVPRSASGEGGRLLASISWDGAVRIHSTGGGDGGACLVLQRQMESGPLLGLAATISAAGSAVLYTGGLDGAVRRLDVGTGLAEVLGSHGGGDDGGGGREGCAASCVCAFDPPWEAGPAGAAVVVSAGWDGWLHVWEVGREREEEEEELGGRPAASVRLPGKAFGMDGTTAALPPPDDGGGAAVFARVVVATSGRRTVVVDLGLGEGGELLADLRFDRESSLKYQTRVIKCFPDGTGLALGSIEGRVAVEYLDEIGVPAPPGTKRYAFKCHRKGDVVYPVNGIAFHPGRGTFVTGGCDGSAISWDGRNKKKLALLAHFPTSVAALAYSPDGTELAVASSYTFEEGDREHPRDEIYVREVLEHECRPKGG